MSDPYGLRRADRLDQLKELLSARLSAALEADTYTRFRAKLYGFAAGDGDPPTVEEFSAAVEDLRGRNVRRAKVEAEVDAILDGVVGPDSTAETVE